MRRESCGNQKTPSSKQDEVGGKKWKEKRKRRKKNEKEKLKKKEKEQESR